MKRNFFSTLIITTLLFSSFVVNAETTAFNLTLGKTTLDEFTKIYPESEMDDLNYWTQAPMYLVPAKYIDFDGVKEFRVLFDKGAKVTGVFVTLDKNKFKSINTSLAGKYKLVQKEIPFVGDMSAEYSNDEDLIYLQAPHLSFDMTLQYIQQKTSELIFNGIERERKKQKESETSQL